ncbi:MAG: PQQ-binding-like beta-propeller repeat protein, partial [Lentisphaeria bacterium]|nr:PQQ-binding-like beta-propeller repeat protein [Lentisphaeria bacterium]
RRDRTPFGLACCRGAGRGGARHVKLVSALVLLCGLAGVDLRGAAGDTDALAARIRERAGFRGGLIVHLGCLHEELTVALMSGDGTRVHGLAADPGRVAGLRGRLLDTGLHGAATVEAWVPPALPYPDRFVNLVVADAEPAVDRDEVRRVLVPGGVAVFVTADGRLSPERITQAWPDALDQWGHFLHDPSNNAVARDSIVGPPGQVQWTAGPVWSKEHDVTPAVQAPVSARGRLFYVLNDTPVCAIDEGLPDRYSLVARDAFNGITLWTQPLQDWHSSRVIWGHIPVHTMRRLVAEGDRVYVTPGLQTPIVAFDAATGARIREYPGTERAGEILCSDGRLAVVTRTTHPLDGLLAGRDGNRFRRGYAGAAEGGEELLVVRADTGECLWRRPYRCMPLTLALVGDRLFFAEATAVVCLRRDSGEELWRIPFPGARTLVVQGGGVFLATADPKKVTLAALDAATGRQRWARDGDALPNFVFFFAPLDVFVAQGLVWGMAEDLEWNKKPGSGHLLGLDPLTGEVRRRLPLGGTFTTDHHVRCYKGKATEEYLLFNKRGIEFVGVGAEAQAVPNSYQWVRGVCRYGILPCNGLIYAPPHSCACYPGAQIDGMFALAAGEPAWTVPEPPPAPVSRLTRGPAYADAVRSGNAPDLLPAAWPTYRGDSRRSGHTPQPVPAELAVAWTAKGGGRPSSPVVAGGLVLAADVDGCVLHAWQARDGERAWSYPAGGRIDSPPTVTSETAIFGCRDGSVTCLRLRDGSLAWSFRAEPTPRRVGAFDRIESAWPVHGSVLVRNGIAYFAAGRSSFLDGGIHVYGIDAGTGEQRYHTRLRGPDPQAETSNVTSGRMPGALPDILSCDDTGLYLRHLKLEWELPPPPPEQYAWGIKGEGHLIAESGYLDDTLFNRTVWRYGIRIDRSQLLAVDGRDVYGVRVYEGISWNCPVHTIGEGYLIFRQDVGKPVPQVPAAQKERLFRIPEERYTWQTRVPYRVCAMLLAGAPGERLFLAGVPDRVGAAEDPLGCIEGRSGAALLVLDAATGKQIGQLDLPAPPVWDGMAAAEGRLYMTLENGNLLCLAQP